MKEFNIIAKGDVSLVLKKTDLVLPTNTKKKIDEMWKHLKNNNVSLHDGKSAIVKNIKKKSQDTVVDIVFLDYSTIIVDRENPDLNIGVSQIGVSGMIILNKDKKIVFLAGTYVTGIPSDSLIGISIDVSVNADPPITDKSTLKIICLTSG